MGTPCRAMLWLRLLVVCLTIIQVSLGNTEEDFRIAGGQGQDREIGYDLLKLLLLNPLTRVDEMKDLNESSNYEERTTGIKFPSKNVDNLQMDIKKQLIQEVMMKVLQRKNILKK